MIASKRSEHDAMHPMIQRWLEGEGYAVEHEVTFVNGRRADFLAIHRETETHLLIEVKRQICGALELARAIEQARSYYEGYGHPFAIPMVLTCIHHPDTAYRNQIFCRLAGVVYAQLPFSVEWLAPHVYHVELSDGVMSQPDMFGIPLDVKKQMTLAARELTYTPGQQIRMQWKRDEPSRLTA